MNNLQTNALRIAELMGSRTYINDGIRRHDYNNAIYLEYDIIDKFSSYNGLMPIVFECNVDINYRIHIYEECVIFSTADGEMLLPKLKYELEHEFIEALQLAVIKYLELKNG